MLIIKLDNERRKDNHRKMKNKVKCQEKLKYFNKINGANMLVKIEWIWKWYHKNSVMWLFYKKYT